MTKRSIKYFRKNNDPFYVIFSDIPSEYYNLSTSLNRMKIRMARRMNISIMEVDRMYDDFKAQNYADPNDYNSSPIIYTEGTLIKNDHE